MTAKHTPKYRHHKARNCAVVTIGGRDHYLGAYDSPESREKCHRLVAEHLSARREPPPPVRADTPLTVTELAARYWKYAKPYYVKGGKPTSEVASVKMAVQVLRRLYADTPAAEFSPKLIAVRDAMIAREVTCRVRVKDEATGRVGWGRKVVRAGLTRKVVNKSVGRIWRMYAWAVEEELVPVAVHAALVRVKGLVRGKSAAREAPRVRPVPAEHVEAVLPLVPPLVRAMIEVQRLTGARPQDIVHMRPADVDTSGEVWRYRPRAHKCEHHNDGGSPDLDRLVYIGAEGAGGSAAVAAGRPRGARLLTGPRRRCGARRGGRRAGRR